MSDEEDEDLRTAIALSLQRSSPGLPHRPADIIDLVSSDDEDDDLDAPATTKAVSSLLTRENGSHAADSLSGRSVQRMTPSNHDRMLENSEATRSADKQSSHPLPTQSSSFMGLDRKRMEEERLLRVKQKAVMTVEQPRSVNESKKRKHSSSPQQDRRQDARHVKPNLSVMLAGRNSAHGLPIATHRKEENKSSQARPHADNQSTSSQTGKPLNPQGESEQAPFKLLPCPNQQSRGSSGIQYPDGVVKKTWAYGFPREEDDVKIEEIFQKAELELAVLSAPQIDTDWVASKLNPSTKVVLVLQAKTELERRSIPIGAPKNYRFCFPSMEGNIQCMHSKLQLLSYPTHLRICVPTANLVPYDWGECGVMENACFLIDLPRIPDGKASEFDDVTEFGKELLHFLTAMGLSERIIGSIKKFDFSRTSQLAFVHSIGGSHSGGDWKRTGYCGLGNAIRSFRLHTNEAIQVDFLTASIGNLSESFMKSIYLAAKGDDGLTEYAWRTHKASKGKVETATERKLSEDLHNHFRIYFPSRETVANSKGGVGAGGTICFQSKWYNSEGFPRHLMRTCQNRRRGILLHSKMMFVRPLKGGVAWAYVGSANLSESAWGRLVKDKATEQPKLNCRNWECGVVMLCGEGGSDSDAQTSSPGFDEDADGKEDRQQPGMEVFHKKIPVPMVVPGEEYSRIISPPWFYHEP